MGSVLGSQTGGIMSFCGNSYATDALAVATRGKHQTYGGTSSGDLNLRVELGGGKAFTFGSDATSNGSYDIPHWQSNTPGIGSLSTFRLEGVNGNELFSVVALDPDAPLNTPGANFLSDICHGIWADIPGGKEVSADDHEVLWYLRP